MADEMGGYEAIQSFYRLFMMPGHGDRWEIPGGVPDRFDPITVLDNWVETGEAPDAIPVRPGGDDTVRMPELLLCPHPAAARVVDEEAAPHVIRCEELTTEGPA